MRLKLPLWNAEVLSKNILWKQNIKGAIFSFFIFIQLQLPDKLVYYYKLGRSQKRVTFWSQACRKIGSVSRQKKNLQEKKNLEIFLAFCRLYVSSEVEFKSFLPRLKIGNDINEPTQRLNHGNVWASESHLEGRFLMGEEFILLTRCYGFMGGAVPSLF